MSGLDNGVHYTCTLAGGTRSTELIEEDQAKNKMITALFLAGKTALGVPEACLIKRLFDKLIETKRPVSFELFAKELADAVGITVPPSCEITVSPI